MRGSAQLRPAARTTNDLLQARDHFEIALKYLQNDPSTTFKQVAKVCQKLTDTSLDLSRLAQTDAERRQHADQARRYGEVALDNVLNAQNDVMIAHAEFSLAIVGGMT